MALSRQGFMNYNNPFDPFGRNEDNMSKDQRFDQLLDMNQQLQGQLGEMNDKFAGRPDRPEWQSLLGPDGLMQEQYQLGDTLNRDFMTNLRQQGLRQPGTQSVWRQLMEDKVNRQAGQAGAGAQAQMQNAMSNLAMRGGLRGGTAERMAQAGANQATRAQQGVLGQRINLDLQDEQMRKQDLMNLGQAEIGLAQFDRGTQEFNIKNALNENLQRRAEEINAYNEQMRAWASERTAEATPSGGGGKK